MKLLVALAALLFLLELFTGPAGLDPYVIQEVRLPRAMGAVATGLMLALAGLLLQTAIRNPLADPYVLGVSGVAQLAALASYVGWRLAGVPYVGYFAGSLAGATVATALLAYLARRAEPLVVVMTGVLMAFVSYSATQLLLLILPPEELGFIYVGLQGSFAAYPAGVLGYGILAAAMALWLIAYLNARHIAVLAHGEDVAAGLGADVKRASLIALLVSSIAVGFTVASVGPVGFIGLLAPHMARWLAGRYRFDKVMWIAAGLGPILALVADLAVKALPRETPVGTVLTLVGAPAAAYLMWRHVGKIRG
ncbi:iron ABC transporter permease [Pyrobaculum sp.]|uniref:FecCD family ABC transporter permease n=1 Tax=Pyrobaculum sp. TaxID=2004705 RepID=UPI00317BD410